MASLFHYIFKELIENKNVECLANPRVDGQPLPLFFEELIKDINIECLAHPRVGGEPLKLYYK